MWEMVFYRLYSGLFVLLRLKVRVDIREVVERALSHRHLLSQVMSEARLSSLPFVRSGPEAQHPFLDEGPEMSYIDTSSSMRKGVKDVKTTLRGDRVWPPFPA